jgi:hypothetical protein
MATVLSDIQQGLSEAARYQRETDEINEASKWWQDDTVKLLIEARCASDEWANKLRLATYSAKVGSLEYYSADSYAAEFRKMVEGIDAELSELRSAAISQCCTFDEGDDYEDDAERFVTSVQDAIRKARDDFERAKAR